MLRIKLKSSRINRLRKALDNYIKKIVKPINKANTEAARDIIRTARKNLDANLTNDTGRLKASIVVLDRREGGLFIDTGTGVNYAIDIEEGTKPHSLTATEFLGLMEWVGKKLKVPSSRRFITAVWISNKIEEVGTDAQPFLGPAANEVRPRHKKAVISEIKKHNRKLKK